MLNIFKPKLDPKLKAALEKRQMEKALSEQGVSRNKAQIIVSNVFAKRQKI